MKLPPDIWTRPEPDALSAAERAVLIVSHALGMTPAEVMEMPVEEVVEEVRRAARNADGIPPGRSE